MAHDERLHALPIELDGQIGLFECGLPRNLWWTIHEIWGLLLETVGENAGFLRQQLGHLEAASGALEMPLRGVLDEPDRAALARDRVAAAEANFARQREAKRAQLVLVRVRGDVRGGGAGDGEHVSAGGSAGGGLRPSKSELSPERYSQPFGTTRERALAYFAGHLDPVRCANHRSIRANASAHPAR